MILVVTEKFSVAKEVANAIGSPSLNDEKTYFTGPTYWVTWLQGHVIESYADEMESEWDIDRLPLLPEKFRLRVCSRRVGGEIKADAGALRCVRTVKELSQKCDMYVNAGDCAREGELIQRNVINAVGYRGPVMRLWISSLTKEAIVEGFATLRNSSEFENLYRAGRARNEADYLVGINATRALTLHSGMKGAMVLSLGRVQTPVLAMICKRFINNRDFKSEPYWYLTGSTSISGYEVKWRGEKNFDKREEAEQAYQSLMREGRMTVDDSERKTVPTAPPLLHDITSLQKLANAKYGYTAEQTLNLAQQLYEKGVTSYPRTGSRYIPESLFKTVPSLMEKLLSNDRYAPFVEPFLRENSPVPLNRRSVDDDKIEDHYALVITGKAPDHLSSQEQTIYDLILQRFVEAFMEPALAQVANIQLSSGDGQYIYRMHASRTSVMGWKAVNGGVTEDDNIDDEDGEKDEAEDNVFPLPAVRIGERVRAGEFIVKEAATKPRPVFTDATLLAEMEHAGRVVDDRALKEAIKECGIGTPATRAAEIEVQMTRGYVERKNKRLVPTTLGLSVYDAIKDSTLADVETTADWELCLQKIAENGLAGEFENKIRNYTGFITKQILEGPKVEGITFTCPKCGGTMNLLRGRASCTSPGCGLVVWQTYSGKTLSIPQLNTLVTKRQTPEMSGFVKEEKDADGKVVKKKSFAARLVLNDEFKVEFEFVDHSLDKNGKQMTCPRCGQPVKVWAKSVACSSEPCGWWIPRSVCGKTLTDEHIQTLLSGGTTSVIKGMKTKDGKEFDAKLLISAEGKLQFEFPPKLGDSLKCPCCGGPVFVGEKVVSCKDKSCGWFIFRNFNGKVLTDKGITELLTVRRTHVKGFVSKKTGKAYDSYLILSSQPEDKVKPNVHFEEFKKRR